MSDPKWLCNCCTRVNLREAKTCRTCGRPRVYVPKSEMDPNLPKPMLLHGNDAIHFRPEQVQHLIDSGYDLNCRDSQGWTPLLCAVRAQALDVVTALLEHKTVDKEAQTRVRWLWSFVSGCLTCNFFLNMITRRAGEPYITP